MRAAVVMFCLLLAACGGGGSGEHSNTASNAPPTPPPTKPEPTELDLARHALQAEIDAAVAKYPELGDFQKLSRTWAQGSNGWTLLAELAERLSELSEYDDTVLRMVFADFTDPSDEGRATWASALKATEPLAKGAEKLLDFDCLTPFEGNPEEAHLVYQKLRLVMLLIQRAQALHSLGRTSEAEAAALLSYRVAALVDLGRTVMDSLTTSGIQSMAAQVVLKVAVRSPEATTMLREVSRTTKRISSPKDTWIGECAYVIALLRQVVDSSDADIAKQASDDSMTSAEWLRARARVLRQCVDLVVSFDLQPADLLEPLAAGKLVAAVLASVGDREDNVSALPSRLAQSFFRAALARAADGLAFELRRCDLMHDSLDAAREAAMPLLKVYPALSVEWHSDSVVISVAEDFPTHRLATDGGLARLARREIAAIPRD